MEKKTVKQKNEKTPTDKPQEQHFDYAYIEKLREQAWADPEVKENWKEFDKKQKENNSY